MSRIEELYPEGRVTLREVGLRDGLQLVKTWPSTAAKQDWIRLEAAAGVRVFEAGSFLPSARFPQFADVREVIAAIEEIPDARASALAMNERAADDALQTALDEITCVVSATEEHSQANARRSRQQAVELVRGVVRQRDASNRRPLVNAGIAMAFGCSIAGKVAEAEVLRLVESLLAAGADIVGIADTVGFVGPKQVGELTAAVARLCGPRPFIVHLHDTRGMGIANAAAALDNGARVLDASLGGLGGCPFAPGASGNVVFEDLVYLCETKGFATGIDIEALASARQVAEAAMPGEPFHGALAAAGPPRTVDWRA